MENIQITMNSLKHQSHDSPQLQSPNPMMINSLGGGLYIQYSNV